MGASVDQSFYNTVAFDFLSNKEKDQADLNRLNDLFLLNPHKDHKPKTFLRWAFGAGKKFVDLLDDIWNALRSFLPEGLLGLTPVIIGGVLGLIHGVEFYENSKRAYNAYRDKRMAQRKTTFMTASLSVLLGAAGIGLSIALFLHGIDVGLTLAGAGLMPAIIPALLTVIFSLKLGCATYALHVAEQNAAKAEAFFKEILAEQDNDLSKEAVFLAKERYHFFYEQKLNAERKLAFQALEALGSGVVVAGITVGLAAGSIASLGILPLSIILVGVTIGFLAKTIKYEDGKHDFSLTRKMRSYFTNDHEFEPIYEIEQTAKIKHLSLSSFPEKGVNHSPTPKSKNDLPKTVAKYASVAKDGFFRSVPKEQGNTSQERFHKQCRHVQAGQ